MKTQMRVSTLFWGLNLSPDSRFIVNWDDLIFDDPELSKGKFASRSEAARFAAEQRWKGHRKEDATTRTGGASDEVTLSTPTSDLDESLRTGRPFAPLKNLVTDPELVQAVLDDATRQGRVDDKGRISVLYNPKLSALNPIIARLKELFPDGWEPFPMGDEDRQSSSIETVARTVIQLMVMNADGRSSYVADDTLKSKYLESIDPAKTSVFIAASQFVVEQVFAEGQYWSQFVTAESGGYYGNNMRADFEAAAMGIPPMVDSALRPIYGAVMPRSAVTDTSQSRVSGALEGYGDCFIELKPEVNGRTTVTGGDSLFEVPSPTRLQSVTIDKIAQDLGGPQIGGYAYIEAQVYGGVRTEDIRAIWVDDEDQQFNIRQTLDEAGWSQIEVLIKHNEPGFDGDVTVEKAKFASRSEAGRYAAHVRWSRERGIEPIPVEEWRTGQQIPEKVRSPRMQKIVEMRASIQSRLAKLNDLLQREDVLRFAGTIKTLADAEGFEDMAETLPHVKAADWEKTTIPQQVDKYAPAQWWAVVVDGRVIPNAEVMGLMYDIMEVGELIALEAEERYSSSGKEVDFETEKKAAGESFMLGKSMSRIKNEFWGVLVEVAARQKGKWVSADELMKQTKTENSFQTIKLYSGLQISDPSKKMPPEQLTKELLKFEKLVDEKIAELTVPVADSLRAIRLEVLKEIGGFGVTQDEAEKAVRPSHFGAKARQRVVAALRELPTSWVRQVTKMGGLSVTESPAPDMASFNYKNRQIQVGAGSSLGVAVHETVHAVEYDYPLMNIMLNSFDWHRATNWSGVLEPRTTKGYAKRLKAGTFETPTNFSVDPNSLRIRDGYLDEYSGRIYRNSRFDAHEQLTVAGDHLLFPNENRKDVIDLDHMVFALGMWATL